jgi:signal transduction histidine kinase
MSFTKNLRFRLILLVLLAVIPALAITLAFGLEQRRLAKISAEEEALRLARVVANHQLSLTEGARQLMLALSLTPAIRNTESPECPNFLGSLQERYPTYSAINIVMPDGEIACSSLAEDEQFNVYTRPYFQEALASKDFLVATPIVSRDNGRVVMPFVMPILNEKGDVHRVVVALMDMDVFTNLAQDLQLPPNSVMVIVDEMSTILSRYPSGDEFIGREFPNAQFVQEILRQPAEGRLDIAGLDGVQRFYGFTPVEVPGFHYMKVSIGIPTVYAYGNADRILRNSLSWTGFIGLLALAVAWFGGDYLFLRVVSLTKERDEAEHQLRKTNQQLEGRVAERTAALDTANKQLTYELEERQKVVQQLSQREIELEKMLLLVERSNRELESFAYITSHDLQEPLRKIQAFGDRLDRRYTSELGEEGASFVSRMVSSANRMQLMINDLLSYSRVSSRTGEFTQVNLNQTLNEVLSDLEVRIRETKAEVITADLPVIRADASQMRQLWQNLVLNALKFHRPNTPPVIRIGCEEVAQNGNPTKNAELHLFVEDNGIGFDEKYLDRIFLPFQRLHGQEVYEGSGIGLAICRKIAERHGGSITATSTPGHGSRFIVKIPKYPLNLQGERT